MKRNGTDWVSRGLLATLMFLGITMFIPPAGALSPADGGNVEEGINAPVAVPVFASPLASIDWESLNVVDLCEPVLDDSSQDSMDDFHMPSQWVEHSPFCPEFSRAARRVLEHSVETALSMQMVCCVWRC